jgi:hypothetical protein
LSVTVIAALGVVAYLGFFAERSTPTATPGITIPASVLHRVARKANSLDDLLAMPPEQLARVDIAKRNLLCAVGLPGTEKLDVNKCLVRLDDYAGRVRYWTEQSLWDFRQNPGKFENSEAKFRVLLLISVLQKDFGIHYNDRGKWRNCDFSNPQNAFLHGMIDDDNGGTCASMPVMYVAIGRRLGYPMSMVLAKTHIFARWEDLKTGERFNIEGTNPRFDDHPDSYYREWPAPISDAELKLGWYLKSLTPVEEFAVFLQNRGACLLDNERFAEARSAYAHSCRFAPQDPLGKARITNVAMAARAARSVRGPDTRYRPGVGLVDEDGIPMVYRDLNRDVERINAENQARMRQFLHTPAPPGAPQPPKGYIPPSYTPPNPYAPQPPHQPKTP